MCDDYDDERVRTFWRVLAERESVVALNVVDPEALKPNEVLIASESGALAKPRLSALRR